LTVKWIVGKFKKKEPLFFILENLQGEKYAENLFSAVKSSNVMRELDKNDKQSLSVKLWTHSADE